MQNFLYESDCNLDLLKNKTIAVIGYGTQGHAQANNLRDSGLDIIIGLYETSKSKTRAQDDGFAVLPTKDAVRSADIVMLLVNDEKQAKIYKEEVAPYIREGCYLGFSHGFAIHYDLIRPERINVFMVAPKGPGSALRSNFINGSGLPCIVAVHIDINRDTREVALAYACAIGGGRSGIIESSFREETETDLFGEQAVICGGISELIMAGFETLVNAGYDPYIAYIECLFETKAIVDLIVQYGIAGMRDRISNTAEFGDYTSGKRIISKEVRNTMKSVLKDVQTGEFSKKWLLENQADLVSMKMKRKLQKEHQIEDIGRKFRENIRY